MSAPSVISHSKTVYKAWYATRDKFPKKARYTLGDRIDNRFLALLELMCMAQYQRPSEKAQTLGRAAATLDTLKMLLQLAWEIRALDNARYAEISEGLDDAGKQLGGWRKGIETKIPGS